MTSAKPHGETGRTKDEGRASRAPRPCPICASMSVREFHPFCSKHCADVDLNRWLKGTYAIPAVEPPDDWDGGEKGGDGDG